MPSLAGVHGCNSIFTIFTLESCFVKNLVREFEHAQATMLDTRSIGKHRVLAVVYYIHYKMLRDTTIDNNWGYTGCQATYNIRSIDSSNAIIQFTRICASLVGGNSYLTLWCMADLNL